jgi:hypothetical protein
LLSFSLIAGSLNSFNLATLPDRSFLTPARNWTCMYSCRALNFCCSYGERSSSDAETMLFMWRSHRTSIWVRFDWTILGTWSFFPSEVAESVLTLFLVEHTCALDGTVVENHLGETSSTGRSNHLGAGVTALGRRNAENLDLLLQEGPRREQCA